MKGDFSRLTFDAKKHYSSVRLQQGRVQVDADWNEQVDIATHHRQVLLQNLVGANGVPAAGDGFALTPVESPPDLMIGAGACFVDGIVCENEQAVRFTQQPDWPGAVLPDSSAGMYLAYLDVWQRDISAAEDPGIREVALGGPDTATRSKTIWQVQLLPVGGHDEASDPALSWRKAWDRFVEPRAPALRGRMRARNKAAGALLENQLYRVEIHAESDRDVSFKWSRENGSVTFPISKIELDDRHAVLTVAGVDLDPSQLQRGDWIELTSDDTVLNQAPASFAQVADVDRARGRVILDDSTPLRDEAARARFLAAHSLLRRWDQKPDANSLGVVIAKRKTWVNLENGVQVYFEPEGRVFPGDYWLITARSTGGMGGSIEWPAGDDGPAALPPHGGYHHYGPVALITQEDGVWRVVTDLRRLFATLPELTAVAQTTRQGLEDLGEAHVQLKTATAEALQRLNSAAGQLTQDLLELRAAKAVERGSLYEDVTSPDDLEIGDVVAAGNELPWHVERAQTENQARVFGVVTATDDLPNYQDRVRVTTYGRARCKVVGPVRAGDLLVPAQAPGCARRRRFWLWAGTILGKALADYQPPEAGTVGMIDVMVMLG